MQYLIVADPTLNIIASPFVIMPASPRRKRIRVEPAQLDASSADFDFTLSDDELSQPSTSSKKSAKKAPAKKAPAKKAPAKKAPAKKAPAKKTAAAKGAGSLSIDLTGTASTSRPRRRAAAKAVTYAESEESDVEDEQDEVEEVEEKPKARGKRAASKALDESAFAPESDGEDDAEWGDSDDGSIWG